MLDAALFFAKVQPGQRFRVWPPAGQHNIHAGLILTATGPASLVDSDDTDSLHVGFSYPEWTGRGEGAVWRSASNGNRFELVKDATAPDLCGCGQQGNRVPDPYLVADGFYEAAAERLVLLCPTCLIGVTALAAIN